MLASFSGHGGLDIQSVTQDFSLKQLTSGFYPSGDSPLGSSAGFLVFNLEIRWILFLMNAGQI